MVRSIFGIRISAHQLFHEIHLDLLDLQELLPLVLEQDVKLFVQMADLKLGLEINLVVVFRAKTISDFHAILAHHDHRRLYRRQARQDQVQQDKGYESKGRESSAKLLMPIHTASTSEKKPMNVQLPPKEATRSATR